MSLKLIQKKNHIINDYDNSSKSKTYEILYTYQTTQNLVMKN